MSRTSSSLGMPIRSSLGESSFPVSASPAELKPTLIQGPIPIVNTTGSPGTFHSIATSSSSLSGARSLLWATHTCPSAVAGARATRSEQRPAGTVTSASSSSIESANTRQRIGARPLGHAVDLLHQPGQLLGGGGAIGRRLGERRRIDRGGVPAHHLGGGGADLDANLAMASLHPQKLDRRLGRKALRPRFGVGQASPH